MAKVYGNLRDYRTISLKLYLKLGTIFLMASGFLLQPAIGNYTGSQDTTRNNLCHEWIKNETIRQSIQAEHQKASPCPCYRQQAEKENTYQQTENCFTEYFYTDSVKQRCCYEVDGSLLQNKAGAGFLLIEPLAEEIHEAYHTCCDDNGRTCELFYDVNPSNDCRGYAAPQYKSSGGDLHITTIDGVEYDFNGHGEYVFLKLENESLEIQIRTDYLAPGNNDATIITAVALKAKKTTMNIILNRKAQTAKLYFNSTSSIMSSDTAMPPTVRAPFLVFPPKKNAFHIEYRAATRSLRVDVESGEFLNLKLKPSSAITSQTATGLAGSNISGSMMSRNGTKYPTNSSEHDFYDFGVSWSLQFSNESLFDYNLANGSFGSYNKHHTKPRFLDVLVGNLTELFKGSNTSQIESYNKTCEGHKECLLAIARTGDIHRGQLIMDEIHQKQMEQQRTDNTKPFFFTNWTRVINVTYENKNYLVLDLKHLAGDKEDSTDILRFDVLTSINDTDYTLDKGVFNWSYISPALRYKDVSLTFVVENHFDRTASTPVSIVFCGCEKESQCNYQDMSGTEGKFQRASCVCHDKFIDGNFCDIDIPPCNISNCFKNVTCDNNAKDKDHPCGACPSGYTGDGITCTDINECELHYCAQGCSNTEGSYTCSCKTGYILSGDKRNCSDIDECQLHTDNCSSYSNTRCRNTIGGYVCDCKPKFHKASSGTGNCEEGGFSYVAELVFDLSMVTQHSNMKENYTLKPMETKQIQVQLTKIFANESGVVSIEVTSARVICVSSRLEKKLEVEFLVITNNQTCTTEMTGKFRKRLMNVNKSSYIWDIPLRDIPLADAVTVLPENKNRLCEATMPTCDKESTDCKQRNGNTFCDCKKGFVPQGYQLDYCTDVDECSNTSYLRTNTPDDRCYQGKCHNTHGSWTCSCPTGKTWKQTGENQYRCLDDYQYIGNISFQYLEAFNESRISPAIVMELDNLFNSSNVNITDTLKMNQVFIKTEIIDVQPVYTNNMGIETTIVSAKYIIHVGEALSWKSVDAIQNQSLKHWTWTPRGNSFKAYVYDEAEYSICNIPGKTDCQLSTSVCEVTNGSYHCNCKEGFSKPEQTKNQKFCTDINECELYMCDAGNSCCSGVGKCQNTIGNWTCNCPSGYESFYNSSTKNMTCIDIDECNQNETYVCKNGHCQNRIGSWSCTCDHGYQSRNNFRHVFICEDIDECGSSNYKCASGSCENYAGSWGCICPQGYRNTSLMHQSGITSTISCENINECNSTEYGYPACLEETKCVDSEGSWDCLCRSGQTLKTLNSTTKLCAGDYQYVRILEFTLVQNNPDISILKTELQTKLLKLYSDGLKNETAHVYLEITDIVLIGSTRSKRETNTGRDYKVTYIVHTEVELAQEKVDEVITDYLKGCDNDSCGQEDLGDFDINIRNKPLVVTQQYHLCDISSKNHCDLKSTNCTDTNNTIDCICKDGYQPDPFSSVSCMDIDECEKPDRYRCYGNRSENGKSGCVNRPGDWTCSCQQGFDAERLNQYNITCTDINECNDTRYSCKSSSPYPDVSQCTNTIGNWTCACKDGYRRIELDTNKYICEDIDECSDTTSQYVCESSSKTTGNGANCINTEGGWSCTCVTGFKKQTVLKDRHYVCKDVCDDNPCQNDGNCLHKDTAVNFTCVCTAGWTGDFCELKETDEEASHLKTILIACCSAAAALIVLLLLAIFGIWRHRRYSSIKHAGERLSLNTLSGPDSWPFKNGNVNTSPSDKDSLSSERNSDSRRLSIPRPQLGNSTSDLHLEESVQLRNPAPDYDLHFPTGFSNPDYGTNPAPDYETKGSPLQRNGQRPRSGSFNRPSNKYRINRPSYNQRSLPAGLVNDHSHL